MRIERLRRVGAESGRFGGRQHEQLLGRVGEMVLAAHHMGDAGVEVVDRDREVVEHRTVRARNDGVVEMDVFEHGVAPDSVVHDGGAPGRHVQSHRATALPVPELLSAEPALGAVKALVGGDVVGGGVAEGRRDRCRKSACSASRWRGARSL